MKMFRGFYAILTKEFIVVLRDPVTLFFMLFPPLVEMIAFGYALDNDVKHMATIVLNEDRNVESRQLIAEIRRGHAYVGIHIPPNFARDLRAGRAATAELLIDGSSSTIALQALNTSLGVALKQSLATLLEQSGRRTVPIEVRAQMLYNPSMRSPNFYIPGVIGVVLQIATTFATAMSVVRERERGTLEQLLVSPLSRWGFMLCKFIPYWCVGMAMAIFLLCLMRFLFQVPIAGSLAALFLATLLYTFSLLSIGLLVSTRAETQMQALQMSMALILPTSSSAASFFRAKPCPGSSTPSAQCS